MIQLITLERNWSTVGDNCRMSPVSSKDKKKGTQYRRTSQQQYKHKSIIVYKDISTFLMV